MNLFLHKLWWEWLYPARCYLWNRWSTVKPRWLGHTWIDRSELLTFAMFEVLARFLEECEDYPLSDPEHYTIYVGMEKKTVQQEMEDLLDWFLTEYLPYYEDRHPVLQTMWDQFFYDDSMGAKIYEFELEMQRSTKRMLTRLVAIRGYLWT